MLHAIAAKAHQSVLLADGTVPNPNRDAPAELTGKVDTVLSRGAVVVRDGEYVGAKGHGRYLRRGQSQYLR